MISQSSCVIRSSPYPYLALIGSVIAFLLYYWLMRNMAVTNTQLISLVTPIVAVVLGVAFLDEKVTWRLLLGGFGIFTGIGIIITRQRKSLRSSPLQ